MAITLIGAQTGSDVDSDLQASTAALDTTGATLLVACVVSPVAAITTITDSKSNSWTPLTEYDAGGTCGNIRMFYSIPTSVGSGHTVTTQASLTFPTVVLIAFAGTHATTPFDQENGDTTTFFADTQIQTGSVTPSEDDEVIITFVAHSNHTVSINSGFTIPANGTIAEVANSLAMDVAYLIQGSAAAVNPTWTDNTGSTNWATNIATFKAAAGGAVAAHHLTLLGVGG